MRTTPNHNLLLSGSAAARRNSASLAATACNWPTPMSNHHTAPAGPARNKSPKAVANSGRWVSGINHRQNSSIRLVSMPASGTTRSSRTPSKAAPPPPKHLLLQQSLQDNNNPEGFVALLRRGIHEKG